MSLFIWKTMGAKLTNAMLEFLMTCLNASFVLRFTAIFEWSSNSPLEVVLFFN